MWIYIFKQIMEQDRKGKKDSAKKHLPVRDVTFNLKQNKKIFALFTWSSSSPQKNKQLKILIYALKHRDLLLNAFSSQSN